MFKFWNKDDGDETDGDIRKPLVCKTPSELLSSSGEPVS